MRQIQDAIAAAAGRIVRSRVLALLFLVRRAGLGEERKEGLVVFILV